MVIPVVTHADLWLINVRYTLMLGEGSRSAAEVNASVKKDSGKKTNNAKLKGLYKRNKNAF
mgnify:CR=1 FL=1